jgi:hypothetical protein
MVPRLRSNSVTHEQPRIKARRRRRLDTRNRVRDDVADRVLALHDLDDPELVAAGNRRGEHHPVGHIQLPADAQQFAGSFKAHLAG